MFDFNDQNIRDFFPDFSDVHQLAEKIMLGSCLYGTILSDVYEEEEKREIYNSLKVLCGKFDTHPFDKYGIYTYWDYSTREILYIGLSKDLVKRFSQHNKINSTASKGNKSLKILEYLESNKKIGFSILVQPPLIQDKPNLFDKDKEVKIIESSLFQSFKNTHKRLPVWNEVEGYNLGKDTKLVNRYGDILDMLSLKNRGYLNGNSTIREVADSKEIQMFECDLNLIRSHMYQWKEPFEKTLMKTVAYNNFLFEKGFSVAMASNYRLVQMLESGYANKVIKI